MDSTQKYLELIIASITPMTTFLSKVTVDLAFIAGLWWQWVFVIHSLWAELTLEAHSCDAVPRNEKDETLINYLHLYSSGKGFPNLGSGGLTNFRAGIYNPAPGEMLSLQSSVPTLPQHTCLQLSSNPEDLVSGVVN